MTAVGAIGSRMRFRDALALVGSTTARRWKACLVISTAYGVLSGLVDAMFRGSTGVVDPTTLSAAEVASAGVEALVAVGMLVLVNVFVGPVTLGALSLVGSAAVYGDEIEIAGIVRRAFDRALDAVAAGLLISLIVGIPLVGVGSVALVLTFFGGALLGFGTLLFASIVIPVPLIYVVVRLSLAIPVVMREGAGPVDALRRSWKLVHGAWLRVFGLVAVPMALVVVNVFGSFRSFVGDDVASDFVLGAVFTAVAAIVSTALFGVASGVAYATRTPEDRRPADPVAVEPPPSPAQ